MKSNAKSKIVILITLGIFLALLPINTNIHSDGIAFDNEILQTSEVSGKISINGNSGWADFKTAGNCTGDGTSSVPYVIEDLVIDGGGSGSCILIENSDVYFRIENCTIYNSGGYPNAGISLSNVTNGKLLNNTISFNEFSGITIKTCKTITIGNNTINSNTNGIYTLYTPGTSVNISILENEIYNNTRFGIHLYWVINSYISKNNVSLGSTGIVTFYSNDLLVTNNRVEDCTFAIYGGLSNNLNLTENIMISCGISIYGEYSALSTYSIDTSNKVNGKPVYFHLDSNNLNNADYLDPGQIILVNCNSSNVSEINISQSSYALTLLYCNNVSVLDCNFSDNFRGVYMGYSNNTDISRNIVDNNRQAGIYLEESNNNSISLNNISNNYDDQGGPVPPSRDEVGIGFWNDSNNNTIDGNTINNNKIGIYIGKGAENTVKGNYITENYEYGLFLENYLGSITTLNLIYCNSFNSNGINAQDNGTTNMWDNGTIGNSWDDYSGKDADDDGIGDTPYSVLGSAGSQDNYPIFWDPLVFSLNSPSPNDYFSINPPNFDISIEEGVANLTWYTLDDGITNKTFTGLTGTIDQVLWGSTSDGPVTIRFYANDSIGNIAFEEVTINKDTTVPIITINTPSTSEIFGINAPGYNLTIIEPNIHTMWYTLDSGTTNITFTGLTGTISQTIWDSISEGDVTIRFYVNDSAGNITFEEIKVIKRIPEVTGIPGYNLFVLLGIISVVASVISIKLKKFNK